MIYGFCWRLVHVRLGNTVRLLRYWAEELIATRGRPRCDCDHLRQDHLQANDGCRYCPCQRSYWPYR